MTKGSVFPCLLCRYKNFILLATLCNDHNNYLPLFDVCASNFMNIDGNQKLVQKAQGRYKDKFSLSCKTDEE